MNRLLAYLKPAGRDRLLLADSGLNIRDRSCCSSGVFARCQRACFWQRMLRIQGVPRRCFNSVNWFNF